MSSGYMAPEALVEIVDELLDAEPKIDGAGWSIYDPQMSPEFLLLCPHSYLIEQDGRCPKGCVSPMIKHGLA